MIRAARRSPNNEATLRVNARVVTVETCVRQGPQSRPAQGQSPRVHHYDRRTYNAQLSNILRVHVGGHSRATAHKGSDARRDKNGRTTTDHTTTGTNHNDQTLPNTRGQTLLNTHHATVRSNATPWCTSRNKFILARGPCKSPHEAFEAVQQPPCQLPRGPVSRPQQSPRGHGAPRKTRAGLPQAPSRRGCAKNSPVRRGRRSRSTR